MMLTRSAFSVMIKFSGLISTVETLIDQFEEGALTGDIPKEDGPERNAAITKVFSTNPKGEELIKCWASATQMRRWLT